MARRALIVQGGRIHQPKEVAEVFRNILCNNGFQVDVSDTLDVFTDTEYLESRDLVVPIWTGGELSREQENGICTAVERGVGLAGCHGGMCDAFRTSTRWQFMTGGNWVAHPGGNQLEYSVRVIQGAHPIVDGIDDFIVRTEQYYLHVDPAVRVLATTRFPPADGPHARNGTVDMPVIWTKHWGEGNVFYCSIGHTVNDVQAEPVSTIMSRGFGWAAR